VLTSNRYCITNERGVKSLDFAAGMQTQDVVVEPAAEQAGLHITEECDLMRLVGEGRRCSHKKAGKTEAQQPGSREGDAVHGGLG